MVGKKRVIGATLAALALLPGAAWAAGQITGVVANPNPAYVNQEVTVTVQGSGTCSQVVVRCQAPAAPEHVQTNVALPFSVTCTYAAIGAKTVTASAELPNPDCPGDQITQVTVNWRLGIATVDTAMQWTPRITGFFPFSKPSPGGAVLVTGSHFGSQPGKLQLVGQFGTVDLVDLEWCSNGKCAGGRVPETQTLCGVQDHPAKFVVVAENGRRSNEWPVTFLAKKEWKWLSWNDVEVVSCSDDGNVNDCNDVRSAPGWGGPGVSFHIAPNPNEAISGYHYNCWGCVGNDSGIDRYQVTLKNGWTLSSLLLEEHDPGSEGDVHGPAEFPIGASSWAPQWAWMATPSDSVWYTAAILVEGPCGTNHK